MGGVWGKGTFLGFDLGAGAVKKVFSTYYNHNNEEIKDIGYDYLLGIGLNFGSIYEFSSASKLVYGVSGGFWASNVGLYYFGPFARLRLNYFELSNRLLIGGDGVCYQLGIGLYFEGKRHHR